MTRVCAGHEQTQNQDGTVHRRPSLWRWAAGRREERLRTRASRTAQRGPAVSDHQHGRQASWLRQKAAHEEIIQSRLPVKPQQPICECSHSAPARRGAKRQDSRLDPPVFPDKSHPHHRCLDSWLLHFMSQLGLSRHRRRPRASSLAPGRLGRTPPSTVSRRHGASAREELLGGACHVGRHGPQRVTPGVGVGAEEHGAAHAGEVLG